MNEPFSGIWQGGNSLDALNSMAGNEGFIFTDVAEFHKAVTANAGLASGGTDVAQLTGGAALRLQSIEQTLLRTIQEDKHFKLFNSLAAGNATAISDEWTIKRNIGGYPGSAFNTEMGAISETQGSYERKTGAVKFLMSMRTVSVVQTAQRTLVDTIAEEKVDATRELKTSAEWGFFYGDSAVQPVEFDGLLKQITDNADSDLIVDVKGGGLSYVSKELINLAAAIASQEHYGTATNFYCSLAVQAAEIDQKLDPSWRIGPRDETRVGTPVKGIRTSQGPIVPDGDVFITEGDMPFESRSGRYPAIVTAAALTAPVIASAVAAPNASSEFAAAHAGSYYWGVESIGKKGRSTCVVSDQVAVAAGDGVTLSITNPADANVTGYMIHRSRKNGTNAKTDLRECIRIARAAGATTTWVDNNLWVPGTSHGFLLNQTPGANAINVRRLLPMTMFPLYPTNTAARIWAQLLFLYLRIAKINQHGLIKNILPAGVSWQPF